jgi:hypothetical protein
MAACISSSLAQSVDTVTATCAVTQSGCFQISIKKNMTLYVSVHVEDSSNLQTTKHLEWLNQVNWTQTCIRQSSWLNRAPKIPHTLMSNYCTHFKNFELLKHFKIKEAAAISFGLQGNHHQGTNGQYLAKIIHLVQCGYIEVVQTLSVLCDLWGVCAVHTRLTGHTMQP